MKLKNPLLHWDNAPIVAFKQRTFKESRLLAYVRNCAGNTTSIHSKANYCENLTCGQLLRSPLLSRARIPAGAQSMCVLGQKTHIATHASVKEISVTKATSFLSKSDSNRVGVSRVVYMLGKTPTCLRPRQGFALVEFLFDDQLENSRCRVNFINKLLHNSII